MEDAPRKFFRLKPGGEVRLRFGYIIRCDEVIKDDAGEVIELRCSYDPDTRSGTGSSDRKVKGTIHWVSCEHAIDASVRLYDRLFTDANPNAADDVHSVLNAESLETVAAKLEPSLADCVARRCSSSGWAISARMRTRTAGRMRWCFNRIVTLRDSWAKIEKQAMLAEQLNSGAVAVSNDERRAALRAEAFGRAAFRSRDFDDAK